MATSHLWQCLRASGGVEYYYKRILVALLRLRAYSCHSEALAEESHENLTGLFAPFRVTDCCHSERSEDTLKLKIVGLFASAKSDGFGYSERVQKEGKLCCP